MNSLGIAAVVLSVIAFGLTHKLLRQRAIRVRGILLAVFSVLAVPSVWFAVYYLHLLPEYEWFYTLHSWPGSEFLVIFLGCAGGATAALMPRMLLALPLFAVLVLGVIPYLKPVLVPLSDGDLKDKWQGDACLQSTSSTCGPASVATILRHFGITTTERQTARAAYSYEGGTEAWYLARYVRRYGLSPRFVFRPTYDPQAGQPAMVGVRLGNAGHFIAVLDVHDDQVTFVDPLSGESRFSIAEFKRHYQFTGFHMLVQQP